MMTITETPVSPSGSGFSFLEELGVYGWPIEDEDLLLASLVTGDPLLMVGRHGGSKTHVATKVAQALDVNFIAYDASKSLFEDVLGFPNVERLREGRVEYLPSEVTVWDKDFILVDEINRAVEELQSKWLELIRSRRCMGKTTSVKWVWSAMNPNVDGEYGVQQLDPALVGRFATFIYPPDVLAMEEADRIRVVSHINGDDAPALTYWIPFEADTAKTVSEDHVAWVGQKMRQLLTEASKLFRTMVSDGEYIWVSALLSRFAVLVAKETGAEVSLDGRRLGFIQRALLSSYAVYQARKQVFGGTGRSCNLTDEEALKIIALRAIGSGIPVGISSQGIQREEGLHKVEVCVDLLGDYFTGKELLPKADLVYRLFTTNDLVEKARILLTEDLTEMVKTKAWHDLIEDTETDLTVLSVVALQVEANRPGLVPAEMMAPLSQRISSEVLERRTHSIHGDMAPNLYPRVEEMYKHYADYGNLGILLVNSILSPLLDNASPLTEADLDSVGDRIDQSFRAIHSMLNSPRKEDL